ncbi:MAG: hypothetical protein ACD_51C00231G0004 [uncultured bacterium]|nr:MAG: hypothetical protein ACD_51C00231G0004 [uncultured bacterium]OGJ48597.1 MAG: hypothetical protein A2344_04830 [Candidatus Peregrinibacteria bacterium RIFOXYB12_FULL_41_12]OGJ48688.1 MAG: hypothetical protein A2244_03255 [Candidatus Peregrinibacteria bacterium RIFOXYA2_FULL_41_18]OGJ52977.1 MAG: hypothetical protein A2448_04170 [Candidatus Peregrinibacteria bacterium RIFOXYC2_FULL_41_22]OGJ53013.1 MAG: hypothetical protein A2336_03690 [Candidatus Peregrinibacteria bacterium RIFOXYB2_FULL
MDDIKFPDEDDEDNEEGMRHEAEGTSEKENDIPASEEVCAEEKIEPAGKVKITFGRFVKLVANHSFLDVVERNSEEEVVISTNLLSDLANAHDGQTERKLPIVFILGITIGIAVTYFLLTK